MSFQSNPSHYDGAYDGPMTRSLAKRTRTESGGPQVSMIPRSRS